MALQQEAGNPALWVNPDWKRGPATFAVVIGVSRYPNLPEEPMSPVGGGEPGLEEKFGLSQLHVSALTASRFFDWLRNGYDHPEAPLARCWLLLSPTAEERQALPALAATPEATFDNCRRALGEWYATMKNPKLYRPADAAASRALFFFSGHGLELMEDNQVLLPSDYLHPPDEPVNEAISTDNLWRSLRGLPVKEAVLVLDACRSCPPALQGQLVLGGARILTEVTVLGANPASLIPILYSAAPGGTAWEPTDPAEGPSVFGQALMEGVAGSGECGPPPCGVRMGTLRKFVRRRVTELNGSHLDQRVVLNAKGDIVEASELVLTRATEPPPPPPPAAVGRLASLRGRGGAPLADALRFVGASPMQLEANGIRTDFRPLHDRFGSETLSGMWDGAVLEPLDGGASGPGTLTILDVARERERLAFRALVQVAQPGSFWLRLPGAGRAYACVLPGDPRGRPVFEVALSRTAPTAGVEQLSVTLSEQDCADPFQQQAARLWRRHRAADPEDRIGAEEVELLSRAVDARPPSPIAATIAALVFLRRRPMPLDALRRLASVDEVLAPELARFPDGPVLLADRLLRGIRATAWTSRAWPSQNPPRLREIGGEEAEEALRALLALEERGLPWTNDVLGLAWQLLREPTALGLDPGDPQDARDLDRLAGLRDQLGRAVSLSRVGGLFAAFMGAEAQVDSALIRPAPALQVLTY